MALPKLYDRIIWHNDTEPALNEDNLNAMSKGLDDVDDRLIDLAGTIMEDVPQIIEDMEILEPAIENIDANVARAETAADNAEVEALKSEGYAAGTQDGVEVTSGEYYQNNAKYYAEIANPPIENTVDFTDIIAVTDAINKAAKDVKLKVTPKQDLHGYANPWVGGAGKNKIPMTVEGIKAANTGGTWNGNVYTAGTLIFTLQTKDNNVVGISVNGSQTSSYFFILGNIALGLSRGLSTWDNPTVDGYTISSGTTGDSSSTYGVGWDNSNNNVYIVMRANASVSNKVFYPQIEVGTSATAFEPYTNICPITGWANAKVTRNGFNQWDEQWEVGGIDSEGNKYNANDRIRSKNYISVIPGETYYYKGSDYCYFSFYTFDKEMIETNISKNTGQTITAPNNAVYMLFRTAPSYGTSYKNDICINLVKTESSPKNGDYVPYQGEETTISLNGTRYGGVLDVDAGMLTLTQGAITIDGNTNIQDNGLTSNSSHFGLNITDKANGASNFITDRFYKINRNDPFGGVNGRSGSAFVEFFLPTSVAQTTAAGQAWFADNPTTVVYELATPQTIQLTPTQVYLLYGYNTLFGDCGDISLTYDASGIIHIEEAKLDTETLKTIAAASSDFADFKARIAAL